MSTKKLVIVGVILVIFQVFSFLVGGLIAPSPTSAVHYLATKCVDVRKHHQNSKWFMPWGPNQCEKIRDFDEAMIKQIEANEIVFAVHIPLPNNEMSPWFQFMLFILQFDIAFKMGNQIVNSSLYETSLLAVNEGHWHWGGYTVQVNSAFFTGIYGMWNLYVFAIMFLYAPSHKRYGDDQSNGPLSDWVRHHYSNVKNGFLVVFSLEKAENHSIAEWERQEPRQVEKKKAYLMNSHTWYLVSENGAFTMNERKKINVGIGEIKDIRLVGIHQNGGFTKVWFAVKTFLTPSILIIMIWYWRRITLMTRPPVLLEKVIFALGISMTFINIPVEWFSVGFNWTWLLFGDIRQGIFYAMLLSFWIIFCGEHLMDQTERNRFGVYWKQVGPIVFGSFCLFIFDMCERGVQLKNPFYSIWASDLGTELAVSLIMHSLMFPFILEWPFTNQPINDNNFKVKADVYTVSSDFFGHWGVWNLQMAFIIVAGICACLYFLFLCFMVFQVFRNINGKRTSLPAMSKARRLHYEGLIFRFKFLMLITLACAALTVIFFIISQGLIFRFKFLMLITLACAALTVIFFIISQVNEGHWHWGGYTVQVNSAFFTGIYGMWNLYVFAIMFLYAPSHKRYGDDQSNDTHSPLGM
ncbi:UNVERIFIED_CONTAM: hypothetical protein FKN15_049435 [Acipenser sinensis]